VAREHWRSTDGSNLPDWLQRESIVYHSLFGRGRIVEIGEHKTVPVLVVAFDTVGQKMLSQEHGIPQLSPNRSGGILKRIALFRKHGKPRP